jgi:DNA-binding transcriptional MerR regulator
MPVRVNGHTYYRTAEVYRMVGISRATLFRWLKEDSLKEAKYRDRRGWRLFTEDEIDRLKAEANHISKTGGEPQLRRQSS